MKLAAFSVQIAEFKFQNSEIDFGGDQLQATARLFGRDLARLNLSDSTMPPPHVRGTQGRFFWPV